jgi:hypothetical protein
MVLRIFGIVLFFEGISPWGKLFLLARLEASLTLCCDTLGRATIKFPHYMHQTKKFGWV